MKKEFWVSFPKMYLIALLVFAGTLCFGVSSGHSADVKSGDLDAKLDDVLQKLDAVSCAASGFIDNLDGTLCDCVRGLMWEKKTGTVGDSVICTNAAACPDPHDVNNRYTWSSSGEDPDGPVFTVFLAQLNDVAGGGTDCFAGHCDWRLPEAGDDVLPSQKELETILDLSQVFCGGGIGACINPIFGPTRLAAYWSATTSASIPSSAWSVEFASGIVALVPKNGSLRARAVRTGPCM